VSGEEESQNIYLERCSREKGFGSNEAYSRAGEGKHHHNLVAELHSILEVMTRPLPFSPLTPLGPSLTRFMPTSKDSDDEVESPHILRIGSAAFGGSSSFGKNGATKSTEGDGSSGRESTEGLKG
jgi:hypothetical protein